MPIPDAALLIAPDVAAALDRGAPVVALESTIVTHGMPYPQNADTARTVEAEVRDAGALPATIAVIDGVCRVGLAAAELDALASRSDARKASRRDLPAVMAQSLTAGTTVAATMFLAARAGIAVFATGGIGGVHRGAETTFDVSADLAELAASPVAVVCAGCKSILDIPRTLEVLETHGVPVIGYGTDRFPAFFTPDSGQALEHRADTPEQVAAIVAAQRALGIPGGLLIANPIAAEHALDAAAIGAAIEQALADAAARGIGGKEATPFLLQRVLERTGGSSLQANVALIRGNARLAARIAVAFAARPA